MTKITQILYNTANQKCSTGLTLLTTDVGVDAFLLSLVGLVEETVSLFMYLVGCFLVSQIVSEMIITARFPLVRILISPTWEEMTFGHGSCYQSLLTLSLNSMMPVSSTFKGLYG